MQHPEYAAYLCYTVSIGIIISHIWRYIRHSRLQNSGICKPARTIPSAWPLQLDTLWNLHEASRTERLLPYLAQLHASLGDTMQSRILGETTLFTSDPRNIKTMLSSNFNDFDIGPRREILKPLLGNSVFTLEGKSWEHSRAFLRPHFANPALLETSAAERHVQAMLKDLPRDTKFDFQARFAILMSNMWTDMVFGRSDEPEAVSARQEFAEAVTQALHTMSSSLLTRIWRYFPRRRLTKMYESNCAFMLDETERALERKRLAANADSKKPPAAKKADPSGLTFVFADEFAKNCDDAVFVRDHLMTVMLAGRESMISLLSWTFWCLSRNPSAFQRLKKEVTTAFRDDIPGGDVLKSCSYLEWTLKEVLRLYPSLPVSYRSASMDVTLPTGGGEDGKSPIFLPKGGGVNINFYSLHRRKDVFGDDAEAFRPERWSDEMLGDQWSYAPFMVGPRVCIGRKFAMRLGGYIVARIVQRLESLEFASNRDEEITYELSFVLGIGKGCPVKISLSEAVVEDYEVL